MSSPQDEISAVMREDWGRLLAVLISDLRDFQLAEDSLSDAFESALKHWPRGLPNHPRAWLLQVARRKAIDRIRRNRTQEKSELDLAYLMELDVQPFEEISQIPDLRLRLIFTACHPALEAKTRVALTLRTLCGLTTTEIARAFLDKESTMAQRLSRARSKITKANIPYEVPDSEAWGERLASVLTVIYLIFNEGYSAGVGDAPVRQALCEEAIELARAVRSLCPDDPEVIGLLALLLLTHARFPARIDSNGMSVPLESQDRTLWNQTEAQEGLTLIETALRRGRPGPFQLQAAISAIHIEAINFEATRFDEITLIYERLLELTPNSVIALNRAVALSFWQGPEAGLAALPDGLEHFQSLHAARADMLRRLGRTAQARGSYDRAIELTTNAADRLLLEKRRDSL